jgi:hypothetical protein
MNMTRPALQRLLADVQAGKIDCVVVNSLDRLARSSEHTEPLKAIFQRHGVAVLSAVFGGRSYLGQLSAVLSGTAAALTGPFRAIPVYPPTVVIGDSKVSQF